MLQMPFEWAVANLAHFQAQNAQNVPKMCFEQKAPGVGNVLSTQILPKKQELKMLFDLQLASFETCGPTSKQKFTPGRES